MCSIRCDWNHGNSQFLYSANFDDNYAGMIYFNGLANVEGWKLTPAGDWNNGEWGMDGTPEAEAPTQILITSGGGNITTYSHNSYYIEFNTTTCELKVSQVYDSWGIVGNHNGWGTGDTPMTLGQETDAAGNVQHFLTATMHMDANNTWKIRPDEKWENDKRGRQRRRQLHRHGSRRIHHQVVLQQGGTIAGCHSQLINPVTPLQESE